jgi:hypothetical protein
MTGGEKMNRPVYGIRLANELFPTNLSLWAIKTKKFPDAAKLRYPFCRNRGII